MIFCNVILEKFKTSQSTNNAFSKGQKLCIGLKNKTIAFSNKQKQKLNHLFGHNQYQFWLFALFASNFDPTLELLILLC